MGNLLIGDVAERAQVPAPTIRYYESIGLLKPAGRSSAGYRRYADGTIDELRFIKKAQALGFSLDEIAGILRLTRAGETPCTRVLSLGHQHLAAVEERIRQLARFRDQLASELAKWDGRTQPACRGLCQIITSADPDTSAEPVHLSPRGRQARKAARRSTRYPV